MLSKKLSEIFANALVTNDEPIYFSDGFEAQFMTLEQMFKISLRYADRTFNLYNASVSLAQMREIRPIDCH